MIDDRTLCVKQPSNIGICCGLHDKCASCGWNPEVELRRKKGIYRKYGLVYENCIGCNGKEVKKND